MVQRGKIDGSVLALSLGHPCMLRTSCEFKNFALGLQLAIISLVDSCVDYFLDENGLVVWSLKCQKMVKNVDQCFPKPKMTSSNVLLCPQLQDIQLTVTEERRN